MVDGDKDKTTYGILAILVGWIGVHKFYVGDTKKAIIHLALGLCGLIIVIPILVSAVIAIISGVKALTGTDEEFHRNIIKEQKWI